jgi:hypothetical protein
MGDWRDGSLRRASNDDRGLHGLKNRQLQRRNAGVLRCAQDDRFSCCAEDDWFFVMRLAFSLRGSRLAFRDQVSFFVMRLGDVEGDALG